MKQTRKLNNLIVCISLLLFTLPWGEVKSQVTNGVFDPSKAQDRERAEELQQIEINILSANQFNRTLGTPDHPGSIAAPPSNTVVPSAPVPTYTIHQSEPPPKRLPRSVVNPDLAVPTFARPSSSRGPLNLLARALSPGPHGDLTDRPSLFANNVQEDQYLEGYEFTAPVLETTEVGNSGSDALDQTLQNLDLPQFAPQTRSSNPFDLIARALAPGPSGPVDRNSTNALPAVNFILRALAPGPQGSIGRQVRSDIPNSTPVFEPSNEGQPQLPQQAQPLRIGNFGTNDPLDAVLRALAPGNNVGNSSNTNAIRPFNFIMRALAPGPIDSPSSEDYQVNFSAPINFSEPAPVVVASNNSTPEPAPPAVTSAPIAPLPPQNRNANENKPLDFIMRALAPGPIDSSSSSREAIPSLPNFNPATPVDLPQ